MSGVIRACRRFLVVASAVRDGRGGLVHRVERLSREPVVCAAGERACWGCGSLSVTPGAVLGAGDRLVVQVGVWNSAHATTSSVGDAAGDTFTEVSHFAAADGTEQSVWTAPITAGAGPNPLSRQPRPPPRTSASPRWSTGVVHCDRHRGRGQSGARYRHHRAAATVASGAPAATTGTNELAVGFYTDSGFGDTLTSGTGYTARVTVGPTGDMELLTEDQAAGRDPQRHCQHRRQHLLADDHHHLSAPGSPTAPAAPTAVTATPATSRPQ